MKETGLPIEGGRRALTVRGRGDAQVEKRGCCGQQMVAGPFQRLLSLLTVPERIREDLSAIVRDQRVDAGVSVFRPHWLSAARVARG